MCVSKVVFSSGFECVLARLECMLKIISLGNVSLNILLILNKIALLAASIISFVKIHLAFQEY
ncbi:hypothetical protein BpHYR1_048310 [Brachionus plicatilis]|uniref:Uncharacterized protein n=1 Tax=Brachionus plicatilis TaxID=10195 RepID=A0A3M7PZU9_BRAPC|nr:hypothetical protein BpHYR1_048310 [Brachionus plicatilis]